MKRLVPLLLLLAACGPKAAPTPPEVGNDDHVGVTHERTPCPDDARLAEIARAVFEQPAFDEMTCVALWAGEPMWLLDGAFNVENDDFTGISGVMALVTTGGEPKWASTDDPEPWGAYEAELTEYTAVDLDGDGDDELLEFGGYSKHGYTETWVTAYDVVDAKLVGGEQLALGNDNTAEVETEAEYAGCYEEHEVIAHGAGHAVDVTRTGLPNEPCDNLGHHVYVWDGHDLKESK